MIIVLTTTSTKKDAEDISRSLLKDRLVACSQIMPIQSMYWWKDKIRKKGEYLCLFKTKDYKFSHVKRKIEDMHPYEVPEIVSLKVNKFSEAYLAWLNGEVKE